MNRVHFRVLSGHGYGLGHVVRARWLAEAVQRRLGLAPLFFELSGFAPARAYLEAAGLPVQPPGAPEPPPPLLEIVDGVDAPPAVLAEACRSGAPVLCFEHRFAGAGLATVVVNAITAGLEDRGWMAMGIPHVGGPGYLLLDPQVVRLRALARPPMTGAAHRVLVSCGGTDPAGRAALGLAWLAELGFPGTVDLVLGAGGTACPDLPAGLAVRVHRNLPTLAPLLHQAELALISGGMTLYEAACLGTPAAVLPQNDHQILNAARFQARGAALLLDPAAGGAPEALGRLLEAPRARQRMARLGRGILSGEAPGLWRIINKTLY
jgi:spore coat polysaccharide biosynthesis predicted glycosyltransferase SpsG